MDDRLVDRCFVVFAAITARMADHVFCLLGFVYLRALAGGRSGRT